MGDEARITVAASDADIAGCECERCPEVFGVSGDCGAQRREKLEV